MRVISRRSALACVGGLAASAAVRGVNAAANVLQLRIAYQPGLNYLPLMVLEQEKLIEAELKQQKQKADVSWLKFSSGEPMNDAMLAGQIDIASGGITVLAVMWDKTRGHQNVRALTALAASPFFLNVNKPAIRTLADFTESDRIAVPVVRISPNAIVLQMAAEQTFGKGNQDRLDSNVVSMANPEANAALLSGRTEITGHLSAPPFCFQQLQRKDIHRVLSSDEVLGEKASTIVTWTTSAFAEANPALADAFISALQKANEIIANDPLRAAGIYKTNMNAGQPVEEFESLIREPSISFSVSPKSSLRMISYMRRVGILKTEPADWKELFFPNIHALGGS